MSEVCDLWIFFRFSLWKARLKAETNPPNIVNNSFEYRAGHKMVKNRIKSVLRIVGSQLAEENIHEQGVDF